jgi:hypothetical protein
MGGVMMNIDEKISLCSDIDCPSSRECRRFLEKRYDKAQFLRGHREPGWVKCRHFMFAPDRMRLEPAE